MWTGDWVNSWVRWQAWKESTHWDQPNFGSQGYWNEIRCIRFFSSPNLSHHLLRKYSHARNKLIYQFTGDSFRVFCQSVTPCFCGWPVCGCAWNAISLVQTQTRIPLHFVSFSPLSWVFSILNHRILFPEKCQTVWPSVSRRPFQKSNTNFMANNLFSSSQLVQVLYCQHTDDWLHICSHASVSLV